MDNIFQKFFKRFGKTVKVDYNNCRRFALIELKNVFLRYTKDYDTLHNVSICLPNTGIVQLVGDNFSANNSLVRVIGGLEKPTSGEVLFDAQRVQDIALKDRGIGYIPHHFGLLSHKTVFDHLYHVLRIRKIKKSQCIHMINQCLQEYGVLHLKDTKIKQLTNEQKVFVAIARLNLLDRQLILIENIFDDLPDEQQMDVFQKITKQSSHALVVVALSKPLGEGEIIKIKGGVIEDECGANKVDSSRVV